MAQRNLWGRDETLELLNIIIDRDYMPLLNSDISDKSDIYHKLKKDLIKCGHKNKTESQIESRWKNLKHQYMTAKKNNDTCPFYDELDELLNDDFSIKEPKCEFELVYEEVESDVSMPEEKPNIRQPLKTGKDSYVRNVDKLGDEIRNTLVEANQDFYETQREIVDHEVERFAQKEAESDKRFHASMKELLTENTTLFLDGLKDIFNKGKK